MEEVKYELRGISDHSPGFSIKTGRSCNRGDWKIGKKSDDSQKILASLEEFIKLNSRTAPLGIMWDTLKVFLQGVLIQQISHKKKVTG